MMRHSWILRLRSGSLLRVAPWTEVGQLPAFQESRSYGRVAGIMDALSHDEPLAAAIYDDLNGRGGGSIHRAHRLGEREWEALREAFRRGRYVLAPLVGKALPDDPHPDVPDGEQPKLFSFSKQGLDFLARHEGLRLQMYNDDQNHCTIGIGHLVHLGPINGCDPSEAPFAKGLTREEAMALFQKDVARFASAVAEWVTSRLNQYSFDALVSFSYNVGTRAFAQSSVLKLVNSRRFDEVPAAMMPWDKPATIIGRRSDEARLFRTGRYR